MKKVAEKILNSLIFNILVTGAVLFSIFAWDFVEGWLFPSADALVEVIYLISFLFFCFELFLITLSHSRWYVSSLFWIYFTATFSMVFDLPCVTTLAASSGTIISGLNISHLRMVKFFRLLARLGRVVRILKSYVFNQIRLIHDFFSGTESRQQMQRIKRIRETLSETVKSTVWNRMELYTTGFILGLFLVLYVITIMYVDKYPVVPSEEEGLIVMLDRGIMLDQEMVESFVAGSDHLYYLKVGEFEAGTRHIDDSSLRQSEIRDISNEEYSLLADVSDKARARARLLSFINIAMILFISLSSFFISWVIYHFSLEVSGTLKTLARALDERDPYTRMHSRHVAEYALLTAKTMGLNEKIQQVVHLAGELHDIGKIGVPEAILQKPGSLDKNEYMVMCKHPEQGTRILSPLTNLDLVLLGVYFHHEKYDGTGYPDGLSGHDIPLVARLLSVCDVWDALTTDRPYRKALDSEQARVILQQGQGKEFDPDVVNAFFKCRPWEMFENEKNVTPQGYFS